MARDLIPPPSPAGRPAPDPEHPPTLLAEPDAAAPEAQPAAPPGPSAFRTRFGFVMGALAGCAVAATVLLVVLISGDGKRSVRSAAAGEGLAADWSPWKPHTSGTLAGAQEIATEIEGRYKNAEANELAKVAGGPISFGVVPATIALPTAERNRYQPVAGIGLQYTLAGFGKGGRLTDGEPSAARHRLLRREALELSLYTFRYLPEVTMVIALLPPAPKAEQFHPKPKAAEAKKAKPVVYQPQAIFYRENELRTQLDRPLATTMATTPPKLGAPAGKEAKRIDGLTYSNLFVWHRIFQQDGRVYLVLDRPS